MTLNQVGVPDTDDQSALLEAVDGVLTRVWSPQGLLDPSSRRPVSERLVWQGLAEVGLAGLPVTEERGGSGGTWTDLAVAGELIGGRVAPTPLVAVAGALGALATVAHGESTELLSGISEGRLTPAIAWTSDGLSTLSAQGEGETLTVSGDLPAVLGSDIDVLLALALHETGPLLVAVEPTEGVEITTVDSLDLTREVSRVVLTSASARVLARGDAATAAVRRGRSSAILALGAELVGVQGHCLEASVSYALERTQFGKPIGSFQGVKHRLADVLAGVELSRATVRRLAVVLDEPEHAPSASDEAAGLVLAAVIPAAVTAGNSYIQVLGGIGYTWEHEAHLYYRRASAALGLFGGAGAGREAQTTGASQDRSESVSSVLTDFTNLVDEVLPVHRENHPGDDFDSRLAWQQQLHAAGWIAPHWPEAFGGKGLGIVDQVEYDRVLGSRRAPVTFAGVLGLNNVAPTLMRFGTPQQQQHLARIQSAEEIWCQGFSEPSAGSDLASLRTRARIEGEGEEREFVIDGQKVWTSEGMEATHCLLLVRTDPDAPAHKGISALLVPLDTPGITRRPITQITGEGGFAEMFFTDVRVPWSSLLGPLNEGWMVTMTTLAFERAGVIMMASRLEQEVEDVVAEVEGRDLPEASRLALLDRLVEARTLGLLGQRALTNIASKGAPGPEHSVIKLVWARTAQQIADTRLSVAGPGALSGEAGAAARTGVLSARAMTIAGGTTEVMKNILAQQVLRLPR
ncbi:acyl-CoA dehydrogenase [Dietzia psychralcaliphila]|uniref:acyl-CoA dehydrogenase n=1 Tax=Dietzia psychralcaliphila TaxID=139021 RepID=UPI001C1E3F69|nr:acyl-CoA dehydrogenase [Dietzia psychralcaliphila]